MKFAARRTTKLPRPPNNPLRLLGEVARHGRHRTHTIARRPHAEPLSARDDAELSTSGRGRTGLFDQSLLQPAAVTRRRSLRIHRLRRPGRRRDRPRRRPPRQQSNTPCARPRSPNHNCRRQYGSASSDRRRTAASRHICPPPMTAPLPKHCRLRNAPNPIRPAPKVRPRQSIGPPPVYGPPPAGPPSLAPSPNIVPLGAGANFHAHRPIHADVHRPGRRYGRRAQRSANRPPHARRGRELRRRPRRPNLARRTKLRLDPLPHELGRLRQRPRLARRRPAVPHRGGAGHRSATLFGQLHRTLCDGYSRQPRSKRFVLRSPLSRLGRTARWRPRFARLPVGRKRSFDGLRLPRRKRRHQQYLRSADPRVAGGRGQQLSARLQVDRSPTTLATARSWRPRDTSCNSNWNKSSAASSIRGPCSMAGNTCCSASGPITPVGTCSPLRREWASPATIRPIYENFFAGGFSTLRGFDFRGASPVRQRCASRWRVRVAQHA